MASGSTKQDQNYWASIDAGIDVRVMQRVVYQCTDEQLETEYLNADPLPIRKRVAFIKAVRADHTVDLDVVGVGLVKHVPQGRTPGTWDCVQSSDDTEPTRI